jgi:5'-nucleotidase
MIKKIALLDLDGTVCDYDKALHEEMRKMAGPHDPPYVKHTEDSFMNERRYMIHNKFGFWRNLERLELGFEIVDILKEIGYSINVLTQGPRKCPSAWSEKFSWCQEHLPNIPVTVTQDKSLSYGRVLVDDFSPYFLKWLEHRPRGLVVCVAHPWNEIFAVGGAAEQHNIFRYDGSNRNQLFQKLKEAYEG